MRRRQSSAIILVGKSILLREGLAKILSAANFRILASVSCAADLLPRKIQLHQPLFLAVHTGDDFGATLKQIELFRDQHSSGRIAIVTDQCRMDDLLLAFQAGVNGYFVNVTNYDLFIKSVELVMMGTTIFPPAAFALDLEGDRLGRAAPRNENNQSSLSARERSIVRCLIEGDTNKGIARKINIAEATVKVHVKAILRKIRVQNRTQAAIWGMSNDSVTRATNSDSPFLTFDVRQPLPNAVPVISEINQIGASVPLTAIGHDAKPKLLNGSRLRRRRTD